MRADVAVNGYVLELPAGRSALGSWVMTLMEIIEDSAYYANVYAFDPVLGEVLLGTSMPASRVGHTLRFTFDPPIDPLHARRVFVKFFRRVGHFADGERVDLRIEGRA